MNEDRPNIDTLLRDRAVLVEMVRLLLDRARTVAAERFHTSVSEAEKTRAKVGIDEVGRLFGTLWSKAHAICGWRVP